MNFELLSFLRLKYDQEAKEKISIYCNHSTCQEEKIDDIKRIDINYYQMGLTFTFINEFLDSIFIYNDGYDEAFCGYKGKLPLEINFSDSVNDIINKLGAPNLFNLKDTTNPWGPPVYWLRYNFKEYFIHLTISSNFKYIEVVTLMVPR